MSEQLLDITKRTPNLVDRSKELDLIKNAIFRDSGKCQVVFVYGGGGIGKSRLAEEILWRGGNSQARALRGPIPPDHPDWDWTNLGNAVIGNVIDLTDISLHTRTRLMTAIRDSIMNNVVNQEALLDVSFAEYDAANKQLENIQDLQGDYHYIQLLRVQAENDFFKDYRLNAQNHRIVLTFDTAEKLFAIGATWLLEEKYLRPEDLGFSAYQWLAEQIKTAGFKNTTLIFIGRKDEGRLFFELLREAVNETRDSSHFEVVELHPFGLDDTDAYIREWVDANEGDGSLVDAVEVLKAISANREKMKVLWLYTGGQPVRLSLYTDLIVEGIDIPDPLNDTLEGAFKRTKTNDPKQITPELERARWEIENEFVRLLFVSRPTLRAQILKTLVRAPRGLDAEQLHFLLGREHDQTPGEWLRKRDEHDLSSQIKQELNALRRLSIVKIRPDQRIGLQDEIYRIYAQHMIGDDSDRADEIRARKDVYRNLKEWAEYWLNEYKKKRENFQAKDLMGLRFDAPSRAYSIRFPDLLEHEEEDLRIVRREIQKWELEAVHYSLLLDLPRNINYTAFELADKRWMANDEEGDAIAQEEIWQVLNDPFALDLLDIQPWDGAIEGKETPYDILKRVAEQGHVIGWIKRFVLRKDYSRAIEFCEEVENALPVLFQASKRDLKSWQHTLSEGERKIWVSYAKILANTDVMGAIHNLEQVANGLETLLLADQNKIVIPKKDEKGFIGHPAEDRVRRVLSQTYNYIGYGFVRLSRSNSAITNYGKALNYLREIHYPSRQATVRNNLSAVLSERGYARARRICLDGLMLRKREGAEVPIGYSYNTLALIDNDNLRPDLAWIEASIALAYFNLAQDPRGQGLALIELGEALRRLARLGDAVGYAIADRPDAIYREAERALNQAIHLFTKTSASKEPSRLVEAYIEKGCLERDLIIFDNDKTHRQFHYREALRFLNLALQLAQKLALEHFQIDTLVNTAWADFYAGDFERAEETLIKIEHLVPRDCWIRSEGDHPLPRRDDLYVYQQLSKMCALRGHMAMLKFFERHAALYDATLERAQRHEIVSKDLSAQEFLQKAAESFVLGLAYSQLFSPRSNALTLIYNALYEYLKRFNDTEMDDFAKYEHKAREKYRIAELQFSDLGDLDEFLRDCFGIDLERD